MKSFSISVILFAILMICSSSYGQFSQIYKYGNVVYYEINHLSQENLEGISIAFGDRKVENRFFDLCKEADSLQIIIQKDSLMVFQRNCIGTSGKKVKLFYRFRPLKSKNFTIKSLKILSIDDTFITSKAAIKYSGKMFKKNETILIPLNEVKGVFLGPGKTTRAIVTGTSVFWSLVLISLL